jgi:glycosyltransferase involved in cell wall biosynthesis
MLTATQAFHINIATVPKGIKRPLWSVIIPTYNCARYLRETLASVLAQDPSEVLMEIIVVDDYSTQDDPEAVVKEFGQGRVQFIRQKENVGKSKNYSKGIEMSTGHYIHLLHGDDTINLGFYNKIESLFKNNSKVSAAFCRCNYINAESKFFGETNLLSASEGILENFQNQIAIWQVIQPPSIVFKREVYETLGTYDKRLKYIEDWEFYVRVSVYFQFAYSPEKLANYRVFSENSSSQSIKGGKRVPTIDQVITIIDEYLPSETKEKISKRRNNAVAIYLLSFIPRLVANKDFKGFIVVTKAFWRYNTRVRLWGRWIRFVINHKHFNRI